MSRAAILLYHWFRDPALGPVASPEFGMEPREFRRQMEWLAGRRERVVALGDLVTTLARGGTPAPHPVAITFDDGYRDFHQHAWPVLGELGLAAALFVVAGRVGRSNDWDRRFGEPERQLLDWPHLRELAAAGIEIGSHSLTHPDLRRLADRDLDEELGASRKRLEDGLGRAVPFLAYPHGLHDRRVRTAARRAGYHAAFAVLLRPWDLLRSDRFALMRAIVHADKSFGNYRLRVALAAPRHRVRPCP
jgi:peptidoglycan/xylan/chitin deacetylase (PgdA/CDA1 family)